MKTDSRRHAPASGLEMRYLIGALLGLAFGIGAFALTEEIVMAIAAAVPIGVTLAIALAEQSSQKQPSRGNKTSLVMVLLLGIIALGSAFVLLR